MINWIKNIFKKTKPEPEPLPVVAPVAAPVAPPLEPKRFSGKTKKINKIDTKDK